MLTLRPFRRSLPAVSALLLSPVAMMALAACGDMPKPFLHSQRAPGFSRLSTAGGVTVMPLQLAIPADAPLPPGEEEAARRLLAGLPEALAGTLLNGGIPAGTLVEPGEAGGSGTLVRGTLTPNGKDSEGRLQFRLHWQLLDADGSEITLIREFDQNLGSRSWETAGNDIAVLAVDPLRTAVEAAMEQPLTRKMAAEAPEPLPGPLTAPETPITSATPAESGVLTPVVIGQIEGFGDQRDDTLRAALVTALKRHGLTVASAAPLLVSGAIGQERNGTETRLRVAWNVSRADGSDAGSAAQENPVPEDFLGKQFAALAVAIADGGADGIAEIVARTQVLPGGPLVDTTGTIQPAVPGH